MTPEGVKTTESDRQVTAEFVKNHVQIGIQALEMIKQEKKTVRHLKFDY
jgi:AMP nucleosidase